MILVFCNFWVGGERAESKERWPTRLWTRSIWLLLDYASAVRANVLFHNRHDRILLIGFFTFLLQSWIVIEITFIFITDLQIYRVLPYTKIILYSNSNIINYISPTFTLLKIEAEHGFRYLNKLHVILNIYLLDSPIHSIQNWLTDEGTQNFNFRNEISYLERKERRTAILNVCIFRCRPNKHEYMLAHNSE